MTNENYEKLLQENERLFNQVAQMTQEHNEVKQKNAELAAKNSELAVLINQLTTSNEKLAGEKNNLTNKIALLEEVIAYLERKRFGRSKETVVNLDQMSLFDLDDFIENEEVVEEDEETEEIVTRVRRKKANKKNISVTKELPKFEKHYVLEGEACTCPDCHEKLKEIGSSLVRQELEFIPAELRMVEIYQHAYKCSKCSQTGATDRITKADIPKSVLSHSPSSPSMIAHTLHMKYGLKVPTYRQVNEWERMGLEISRQTLTNWQNKVAEYYFKPLYDLLHEKLMEEKIIHADETSYKVIESSKENNYFWIYCSSKHAENPIYLYQFDESRRHEVPKEFLKGFNGCIHCDMYPAYQKIEDVTVAGCWAHLRRYFFDAIPINKKDKKHSFAQKIVQKCDQIFNFEKKWKDLSPEERLEKRQKELKPRIDNLFMMLQSELPKTGGKLRKAAEYGLKHRTAFETFLEDGKLEISNNRAERAVKALVIGRKNWLFSNSLKGAEMSGIILSLLETAKANGLNPEAYFNYLLELMPNEEIQFEKQALEAYLPWHPYVQEMCNKKILQVKKI